MPKRTKTTKTTTKKTKKSGAKNLKGGYFLRIPSDTKFLIVHESPSEAKTASGYKEAIEEFLGGPVVIMATIGHFYKVKDVDIKKFEPKFELDRSKSSNLANMKKAWETVKRNKGYVIIGSDPDREGEIIAYEVIKYLDLKKGEYKRLRIRDFSQNGYINALKQMEDDIDWNMLASGFSRQIIDLLIGFGKSPLLFEVAKQWKEYRDKIKGKINNMLENFKKKYKDLINKNKQLQNIVTKYDNLDWEMLKEFENRKYISIGRVQTPTLRLLVEKDLEKFERKLQRKLDLLLLDDQNRTWFFSKNKEYENEPEKIEKVYKFLTNPEVEIISAKVIDIKTKKQKVSPPGPLDTQTAQSSINSIFGYSLRTIMDILQQGYQQSVHTYMRTDSIDVPEQYKDYIRKMIKENGIKAKFVDRDYQSDSEDTQGGHHAILPTKPFKLSSIPGNGQHQKVWEYIIRRSIAAFLEPAEIEYIDYVLEVKVKFKNKELSTLFILKDKRIIKKGFLEVYIYSLDNYEQQYDIKKGEKVKIKEFQLKEKDIKLPGTYTEGSLVKELKKLGIGRPSTWEGIVSTLLDKQYIKKEGGKLVIRPKGYWVYIMIKENPQLFGKIFDLEYTSEMEKALDLIASGKQDKNRVLKDFIKNMGELRYAGL